TRRGWSSCYAGARRAWRSWGSCPSRCARSCGASRPRAAPPRSPAPARRTRGRIALGLSCSSREDLRLAVPAAASGIHRASRSPGASTGDQCMSKATVSAPANIAFIKYWGARDLERALPMNSSISMTLEHCVTQCTVEALEREGIDEIWNAEPDGGFGTPEPEFAQRVREHLARVRKWAGRSEAVRVATRNTFPTAGGLASSASGFAALTLAAAAAFGKKASTKELSLLARRSGSGSACRSVLGGFVEWAASRGNGNL